MNYKNPTVQPLNKRHSCVCCECGRILKSGNVTLVERKRRPGQTYQMCMSCAKENGLIPEPQYRALYRSASGQAQEIHFFKASTLRAAKVKAGKLGLTSDLIYLAVETAEPGEWLTLATRGAYGWNNTEIGEIINRMWKRDK